MKYRDLTDAELQCLPKEAEESDPNTGEWRQTHWACWDVSRNRLRSYRMPIPDARPTTLCGCGKHDIDFGADPYAAHREWLGSKE